VISQIIVLSRSAIMKRRRSQDVIVLDDDETIEVSYVKAGVNLMLFHLVPLFFLELPPSSYFLIRSFCLSNFQFS